MKNRKYYDFEGTQNEAVEYAFNLLMQKAKEEPFFKHTITVPLEDGKELKIIANPLAQQVYYA